ncbi:hypothetical protein ACFJIV_15375 [Mucilaginibacter sp. UC70_90]
MLDADASALIADIPDNAIIISSFYYNQPKPKRGRLNLQGASFEDAFKVL